MNAKEFTKQYYTKRNKTNSIKWDNPEAKDKLPMWIADADFKAPEQVIEALKQKIEHGSYGYGFLPEDYYDTMIKWNEKVSKISYKKDWIRFSKGAVEGISQLIFALTNENDGILINTPVYYPFKSSIEIAKRRAVISKLINENNDFKMNSKDIENKIIKNNVKMMILCSPHNPVGRVWTKQELKNLFEITHKHNVIVISDEVHCELIMPGYEFVPSLSFKKYANDIITINAESKTFSLALFSHCHIIIPNKNLRKVFDEYQGARHLMPNAFNGLASYYAYKYGQEWLTGFIDTIWENYQYMKKQLEPYCDVAPLQGTYLVYINFEKVLPEKMTAYDFLYDKCNIYTDAGELFSKGYEKWARFNLATSLANVKKATKAIIEQIDKDGQ